MEDSSTDTANAIKAIGGVAAGINQQVSALDSEVGEINSQTGEIRSEVSELHSQAIAQNQQIGIQRDISKTQIEAFVASEQALRRQQRPYIVVTFPDWADIEQDKDINAPYAIENASDFPAFDVKSAATDVSSVLPDQRAYLSKFEGVAPKEVGTIGPHSRQRGLILNKSNPAYSSQFDSGAGSYSVIVSLTYKDAFGKMHHTRAGIRYYKYHGVPANAPIIFPPDD